MNKLSEPAVAATRPRRTAPRQHAEGAPGAHYGTDRNLVLRLLNQALATELVCSLRYKRHHFTAKSLGMASVAAEFLHHAREEEAHADRFAERIVQLGGEPDFSPHGLAVRSHAEYAAGSNLLEMIKEDLIAARLAITRYGEAIRYIGGTDPTTRRLFEEIQAAEEVHADELLTLMQ